MYCNSHQKTPPQTILNSIQDLKNRAAQTLQQRAVQDNQYEPIPFRKKNKRVHIANELLVMRNALTMGEQFLRSIDVKKDPDTAALVLTELADVYHDVTVADWQAPHTMSSINLRLESTRVRVAQIIQLARESVDAQSSNAPSVLPEAITPTIPLPGAHPLQL